MIAIQIYTKKEKFEYAKWLIYKFEGRLLALDVIDELLKCIPTCSDLNDMREVRKLVESYDYNTGTFTAIK